MNIKWDAQKYQQNFSFVPQYGEDLLSLITAKADSLIVDLGCGNGTLSHKIADRGYEVLGIDDSSDMIALAKQNHPGMAWMVENALTFHLDRKANVIFSNAVFHWIDADKQDAMIQNISRQLTLGGELVCEFGGKGCAEAVHSTLEKNFQKRNLSYPRTFYFPTIGEYAFILERHGLKVEYAVLFNRPTVQQSANGAADWINMFVKKPFENMCPELKTEIIEETCKQLKSVLYHDGTWFIDYVRIRIRARKIEE